MTTTPKTKTLRELLSEWAETEPAIRGAVIFKLVSEGGAYSKHAEQARGHTNNSDVQGHADRSDAIGDAYEVAANILNGAADWGAE